MSSLLPGTEVRARSLRWEVVLSQQLGEQTLYRLRGFDGAPHCRKLDLLDLFEPISRGSERSNPLPLRVRRGPD